MAVDLFCIETVPSSSVRSAGKGLFHQLSYSPAFWFLSLLRVKPGSHLRSSVVWSAAKKPDAEHCRRRLWKACTQSSVECYRRLRLTSSKRYSRKACRRPAAAGSHIHMALWSSPLVRTTLAARTLQNLGKSCFWVLTCSWTRQTLSLVTLKMAMTTTDVQRLPLESFYANGLRKRPRARDLRTSQILMRVWRMRQ